MCVQFFSIMAAIHPDDPNPPPPPLAAALRMLCAQACCTEHAWQRVYSCIYLLHYSSRYLKESATFALGLNYVQFAKLGLKPLGGGKAL